MFFFLVKPPAHSWLFSVEEREDRPWFLFIHFHVLFTSVTFYLLWSPGLSYFRLASLSFFRYIPRTPFRPAHVQQKLEPPGKALSSWSSPFKNFSLPNNPQLFSLPFLLSCCCPRSARFYKNVMLLLRK